MMISHLIAFFGETVTSIEIAPELEVHKQIQGEIR